MSIIRYRAADNAIAECTPSTRTRTRTAHSETSRRQCAWKKNQVRVLVLGNGNGKKIGAAQFCPGKGALSMYSLVYR